MKRIALLVAVATVLLLVAPPPSPIHLSYVTSDSMAPTLETGDAYLVVDGGTPSTGDILVFDAETRAGYTTHRVVEVTPEGYLTQGDANPTTDQAAGEPPVTEDQTLGTVLTVGDRPLAVPLVGLFATAVGGTETILVAAGLLVMGVVGRPSGGLPDRAAVRVRSVFVPIAVMAVLVAVLSLTLAPTTHALTYTATDFDSPAPDAVPVGERSTDELRVAVHGSALTHTVFEADGATVTGVDREGGGALLTVDLPAREAPGSFDVGVTAVPYPRTLPVATIETLHAVHPVAARFATIGAAFLPLGLLYWLFVDGKALLRTPRNRRLAPWGDRP
jgi:signal peptidase